VVFSYPPNNGKSWRSAGEGLTSVVTSFTFCGGNIFAGSVNKGVFRRPLSDFVSIQNFPSGQSLFKLSIRSLSNTKMEVSFSIPRSSCVTLEIYTQSGRKISTIADNYFTVGKHILPWNTHTIASGYYIIKMQAGTAIQARGIALLK
jgi:hypothetical protein